MVDPQALAPLGLTSYEAAAYVALLSRPEMAPAAVAARAGIPRQRVYDVLGGLEAKGLCTARDGTPKTYAAVDPRIALDLLAMEREATLERQRREARALADRMAETLGPVFAFGHGQNDPLAYVEVLAGQTRIAHRAMALADAAQRGIDACITLPMILSDEQNRTFMRSPLRRGLAYRALWDDAAMADDALRENMAQYAAWGLEVRVAATRLPLKMQAFDNEVVLISMQDPAAGQPSFTAVVIHNQGATAMLHLAFEHLWAQAKPYTG
ncbi:MAG: TrmB family transcriptional regulator [Desulfovibrionaceae bacterium]